MKTIKFSHYYAKLASINCIEQKPVLLLEVLEVDIEDLSKPLLDYDTDNGIFKLPKKGKFLLLLFLVDGVIFTTIRSAWDERKIKYYKRSIGENFKLSINK